MDRLAIDKKQRVRIFPLSIRMNYLMDRTEALSSIYIDAISCENSESNVKMG